MDRVYASRSRAAADAVAAHLAAHRIAARVDAARAAGLPLVDDDDESHGVFVLDAAHLDRALELVRELAGSGGATGATAWRCGHCETVVEAEYTVCWSCGEERDALALAVAGPVVDGDDDELDDESEVIDDEPRRAAVTVEEALDAAGQTRFWKRFVLLALLIVPIRQASSIIASFLHEFLGHGLCALHMNGWFDGMSIRWSGGGWADAYLPEDAAPLSHATLSVSGIMITTLAAVVFSLLARTRRDHFAGRLALLFLAWSCVDFSYVFWNAWHPVPPGDIGTLLLNGGFRWLRWPLAVASFPLMVAAELWFRAKILQVAEEWTAGGTRLRGVRRVVVLTLITAPGLAFSALLDDGDVMPGIGPAPSIFHIVLDVLIAGVLYFRAWEPRPLPAARVTLAALRRPFLAWWGLAIALTVPAVLWFGDGVYWVSRLERVVASEWPVGSLLGVTASPDGQHVTVDVGVRGRTPGESELALLDVDLEQSRVTPVTPPGRKRGIPFSASWLPDSRTLVVGLVEEPSRGTLRAEVARLDTERGEWRTIRELGNTPHVYPVVSRDGESVLLYEESTGGLLVVAVESGASRPLDLPHRLWIDAVLRAFDWNHDGTEVYTAWERFGGDHLGGIWATAVDASAQRPVIEGLSVDGLVASPDGKRIAIVDSATAVLSVGSLDDGTVVTVTTSLALRGVSWSSKGDLLAYVSDDGIMVWSAVTGASEPINLADREYVFGLEWVPGTNDVLFCYGTRLFRVNAISRTLREVDAPIGRFIDAWSR